MSIMPFRAGRRLLSVVLVAALVGPGSALAEVVFGNLGGSGTSGLATTGSAIANNNRLAQGFSTGNSTARTLQSISLGMFWDNSFPALAQVLLYSNVNNAPGSVIAASSLVNVQAKAVYTFPFANVPLAANVGYWVVPPDGLTWYLNSTETSPAEQNGSGYAWLGMIRSVNGGESWSSDATTSYSVSVVAVPEPSTSGMLLAGLAAGGVAIVCRQRRSVTA